MDLQRSDLKELCRICANTNETDRRYSLLVNAEELSHLGKKFQLCLCIEVRTFSVASLFSIENNRIS